MYFRERARRELPIQVTSSEDEGPCFIDSETPVGWIKALSEQSNGITNSRKDLINDCAVSDHVVTSEGSESERSYTGGKRKKKKKKIRGKMTRNQLKGTTEDSANMWKEISGKELNSLETIIESWEGSDFETACNTQDPVDGNTALHKAAIAAKPDMVTQILSCGGDPCIKNHLLQTPYAAAPHHDTRIAFRLFQGQYPDKYNYAKSQIPGPITPELLEQEKEKKAQQKRAKRQREKEKQVEKIKTNKFLQLTDDQKVKSLEPRCFLCGGSLPKVPFEYESYRFCTVRCLQNHRNIRPLHMSA
ncbi:ankyrin repeat and zinc finger domain-containing protein 1-like [Manduca sexta]|uniref:ankyrin repeat and zinc finger domain-containing protein 1-like n=1 Tax=Manduca sexta TaxID=7130 RepID=UPI00188F501D|nr:ankyrin repeat and zinc finger domain-containing protein 1-like [Manduca sexta]